VGGHEALHERFQTLQDVGFTNKYEHVIMEKYSSFFKEI